MPATNPDPKRYLVPLAMLDALPEKGRERVLATARRRIFRRGEVIVRQGDEAASLYIVEAGRVTAQLLTPEGETVTLSVMGPGEVFGEMGVLVARQERTATAVAVDDVAVRVLRREDFDHLRVEHPEVNDFLLHVLARRADRLSRLVTEAHHLQVDRRLARRLLEVGRLFAEGGLPVVIPLTQDELAQLSGTTRPTANQILRKLEADGAIRLARGRVELLDLMILRRRAR